MRIDQRALLLLVTLLLPWENSSAQIPGGPPVDVGRLRGDFYNQMAAKVREVMDAWQETWRVTEGQPLESFYAGNATVLQPGGPPLRGREDIQAFSTTAFPMASGLRTGMAELDAAEGMAYFYGYYAIDPTGPDRGPSTGRHFTIISREGSRWLIRHQFFLPDSGAVRFPGLYEAGLLEPLTLRDISTGPRSVSRFAVLGDAEYVLLALRDAWSRKDAVDARTFFSEEAWVQLPHEAGTGAEDTSLLDRLTAGMGRFERIPCVVLDFDGRDRLAFTFGRYHAEEKGGRGRPGHFLMVLKHDGSRWKIRSLVFS